MIFNSLKILELNYFNKYKYKKWELLIVVVVEHQLCFNHNNQVMLTVDYNIQGATEDQEFLVVIVLIHVLGWEHV
jgi:hypothetical protein